MSKKHKATKEKENVFENVQLVNPDSKNYVVAYYDSDYVKPEELSDCLEDLSKVFPNNNLIALPRMITLVNLDLEELKLYRKIVDKAIAEKEKV